MKASEIALAAGGKKRTARFNKDLAEELGRLPENSGVSEWPKYGGSRVFWKASFRGAVENAFIRALDVEPLTLPKATNPAWKLLSKTSEKQVGAELKKTGPGLAAAGRVLQVALNRQSIVYLSFNYLERLLAARAPAAAPAKATTTIADSILAVVARLQSGPGNYVRVDHLRNSPELRGPVDQAAIALTQQGDLVLGRYEGPRPVSDEDKWNYLEDEEGELFVGVAIPRSKRVMP